MNKIKTGAFITQMRIDMGLTREEISKRIGVSKELLAAYEHGTAEFRSEVLCKLGQEFGCGVLSVMKGVYPPGKPCILWRD